MMPKRAAKILEHLKNTSKIVLKGMKQCLNKRREMPRIDIYIHIYGDSIQVPITS